MNIQLCKKSYLKYFKQIINCDFLTFTTNKIDTLQITYLENNKKKTLTINAKIEVNSEGLLDFHFLLNSKIKTLDDLTNILDTNIKTIDEISLYQAKDLFCKEQALEFKYNQDKYFYILIYTDMMQMSLEIFQDNISSKKFTKILTPL